MERNGTQWNLPESVLDLYSHRNQKYEDMKILKFILTGMLGILSLQPLSARTDNDEISSVEPYQNWYYVYDQNNEKIGSISNQEGELIDFSATIIILKKFNFYYFYNVKLERYSQKPVDAIGRIVSVSSSGFVGEKKGRKVPYDKYGNRK